MKKLTKILALALAIVGAFQVMPVSAKSNITKDEKIKILQDRGIISGYPDGTLGLDKNIKRSEIATLLVKLSGNMDVAKNNGSDVFKDVNKSHWAYGIIDTASRLESSNGIKLISGYPDNTFKPDNEITNAEIIKILVVVKKSDLTNKDVEESLWPNSWVLWGSEEDIVGKRAGVDKLNVREDAKRGDVFAMLYNTIYDDNKNPVPNQIKLNKSGSSVIDNKEKVKTENKENINLAQKVSNFNNGNGFNQSEFEKIFLEFLNADRQKLGLKPLKIAKDLERGTEIRARELAEYGNIKVNGKSHVRVDGSEFNTALNYLEPQIKYTYIGENLLQLNDIVYKDNVKKGELYIDKTPRELAEECYKIWWNSPGHRDNMMNKDFDYISVKLSAGISKEDSERENIILVGTTLFRGEYNNNVDHETGYKKPENNGSIFNFD